MARKFIPIGSMNSDSFGWNSEGAWRIENLLGFGETYTTVGKLGWFAGEYTDATDVQGAYCWRTSWNTRRELIASGTNIRETGVGSLVAGLTNDTYYGVYFAPFGPSIFATNGVDPIQVSTTGAFAAIAPGTVTGNAFADIRPKFLITFKNQLVAANITVNADYGDIAAGEYPHLVWWSSRGNGEMWGDFSNAPDIDGTNYIPIFDDSIEITGLVAGEDCVFIFKEHSIHRLDGPDFAVSPVSMDVGCVAPRTICKVGTGIYFLSQNGLYKLDSTSGELTPIGEGKVSRTLTGSNGMPATVSSPPEIDPPIGVDSQFGVGIADKRISMAADVDNKILCMIFRSFGTATAWKAVLYNIATEQFSYATLDTSGILVGSGLTDLTVYRGPRTQALNHPLGSLRFVCSSSTDAYRIGYITLAGMDTGSIGWVRWPFGFYNPEAEVSIQSVKPIFDYQDQSDPPVAQDLVVNASVYHMWNTGGNWGADGVKELPIGNSNDWNFTFAGEWASRHSIEVEFYSPSAVGYVFGFVGVEVEYEERIIGSK